MRVGCKALAGLAVGTLIALGGMEAQAQSSPAEQFIPVTTDTSGLPVLVPGHTYRVWHKSSADGAQGCTFAPQDPGEETQWWKSNVGAHPSWTDPGLPLWAPGRVRVAQIPAGNWSLPDSSPLPSESPYARLCDQSHPMPKTVGMHQTEVTVAPDGTPTASTPVPLCLHEEFYVPCTGNPPWLPGPGMG